MANQVTTWKSYDGCGFETEAAAEAHESAKTAALAEWVAEHLSDYVAEGDRGPVGRILFEQSESFRGVARRVP